MSNLIEKIEELKAADGSTDKAIIDDIISNFKKLINDPINLNIDTRYELIINPKLFNFLNSREYGFRYFNIMRNRPHFTKPKRKHGGRLRKRKSRY